MSEVSIYALIDPRTGEPFYIGQSTNLDLRFASHLQDASYEATPKARYIAELLDEDLEPEMKVLATVAEEKATTTERALIARGLKEGWPLTNTAGVNNHPDGNFTGWIADELSRRGWSYNELGRRANISSSMLSLAMTGQRGVGLNFCTGVAKAFNLPPEEVLRRAGLLPPVAGDAQELAEIANALDDADRYVLMRTARALLAAQEAG